MRPLPFVWPYALFFWAVNIWAFFPERKVVQSGREGAKDSNSKDSGSLKVIMGGTSATVALAYAVAFVKAWSFPQGWQVPLFVAGLLLIFMGSLLRRYCWRTLGEYFTGDVKARADQPVIRSGPYRFVRHPSYTGAMMMFIGVGLALGNWISVVLITIGAIAAYSYRVAVEERALVNAIGDPYRAYMKERKRFIPYVV